MATGVKDQLFRNLFLDQKHDRLGARALRLQKSFLDQKYHGVGARRTNRIWGDLGDERRSMGSG